MKNKLKQTIKILAGSLILTGTMQSSLIAEEAAFKIDPAMKTETSTTLVTVNGRAISDVEVLAFNALRGTQASDLDTQEKQINLLNQVINLTLLAQIAEKEELDKLPQIKAAVDMARIQVLAEAKVNDFFNNVKITDAEIEEAYKAMFNGEDQVEYKVAHILVANEQEAQDVIKALESGKSFAELAKIHSLDVSKEMGGELGWVAKNQVVAPFGEAMAGLEKGQYTTQPVQTPFGWHVILLEEKRKQTPPPLSQVEEQIKRKLQEARLAEYLTKIRNTAKIEVAGATQTQPQDSGRAAAPSAPATTESK